MTKSLDRLILENVPTDFYVERGLVLRAVLNEAPNTPTLAFVRMLDGLVETKAIETRQTGEFWQDGLRRSKKRVEPVVDASAAEFELVADHATILALIRAYCDKRGVSESEFGRRTVGDGSLTARLREGKDITTKTIRAIEKALSQ